MTRIDIDETIRNAILAALDERAVRLERECAKWQGAIDLAERTYGPDARVEAYQRSLVWNIAALHETKLARLLIGGEPEAADPITRAKWNADRLAGPSESELAGMAGR